MLLVSLLSHWYVCKHPPRCTTTCWLAWVEGASDHLHLSDQICHPASFNFYKCQRFLRALQAKPSSLKAVWMHPGHKDHAVTKAVFSIAHLFPSPPLCRFCNGAVLHRHLDGSTPTARPVRSWQAGGKDIVSEKAVVTVSLFLGSFYYSFYFLFHHSDGKILLWRQQQPQERQLPFCLYRGKSASDLPGLLAGRVNTDLSVIHLHFKKCPAMSSANRKCVINCTLEFQNKWLAVADRSTWRQSTRKALRDGETMKPAACCCYYRKVGSLRASGFLS